MGMLIDRHLCCSFLDHIERIGEAGYCPTNGAHRSHLDSVVCLIRDVADDILHARIQTLGVTEAEYTAPSSMPQSPAWKWKVYDVSGVVSPSSSHIIAVV
jgi:hypothetical protein